MSRNQLETLAAAAREYLSHDGSGIKRTDEWAGDRHLTLARLGRSTSKWLLLALGVGAALGFVAGWVAR